MKKIDGSFNYSHGFLSRFSDHLKQYPYVWILVFALIIASILALLDHWPAASWVIKVSIVLIFAMFLIRPLNAVYGFMGTTGSISIFFFNLVLFCLIFSGIYYFGFFKTAGVSYDINQAHVSYEMFANPSSRRVEIRNLFCKPNKENTVVRKEEGPREWVYVYDADGVSVKDTIIRQSITMQEIHYQNVDYQTVLRNTVLTFLMQAPTDLFSIASTYNAEMSGPGQTIDKQKTEQFHWILNLQVLIGWIFFGVFISLLYNKFRYES